MSIRTPQGPTSWPAPEHLGQALSDRAPGLVGARFRSSRSLDASHCAMFRALSTVSSASFGG